MSDVIRDALELAKSLTLSGPEAARIEDLRRLEELLPRAIAATIPTHRWDEIRYRPTTLERGFVERALNGGTSGFHESLFRSYGVLEAVTEMLERGDSPETVHTFIRWATLAEPEGRAKYPLDASSGEEVKAPRASSGSASAAADETAMYDDPFGRQSFSAAADEPGERE